MVKAVFTEAFTYYQYILLQTHDACVVLKPDCLTWIKNKLNKKPCLCDRAYKYYNVIIIYWYRMVLY